MPIKPVDFQIMIPKTVEVSKNQNDAFSRMLNVQKATNTDIKQETDKSLHQVQHREKTFKTSVDKDAKGKNGYEQGEKKKHQEKDKVKDADKDLKSTAQSSVHIDIKI